MLHIKSLYIKRYKVSLRTFVRQ